MADSNNSSSSNLPPGIPTQGVSSGVGNSTTASYVLSDLSCLRSFPEALRKEMMKHLVPLQRMAPVTCPTCPCYFLEKIPIEVKRLIYGYPLINPILSQCSSIETDEVFGSRVAYGLSPNVLQTCKQIGLEASQVLYEENVFFMAIARPDVAQRYEWLPFFSPLTRHNPDVSFAAMSRVRCWKITAVETFGTKNSAISALTRFLFAISHSKVKSLELLLCPLPMNHYQTDYDRVLDILRPFRILRNVKSFRARYAAVSKIPDILYDGGRNA